MSTFACFLRYSSRVRVLSSSSGSRGLRSAFSPAAAPSAAGASAGAAQASAPSEGLPHSFSAAASVTAAASALSSEVPSSPPQPWWTFLSESLAISSELQGRIRQKRDVDIRLAGHAVAIKLASTPTLATATATAATPTAATLSIG